MNTKRANDRLFSLCGAVFAAAALLVVSACEQGQEPGAGEGEQAQEQEQAGAQEEGAEVGEIEDEPSQFMGEEIVISGEIEEIRGPRAFVVESGGFLGIFDDEMLVLTRSPIELTGGQTLSEDNNVRVRGTVERLIVADIEQELGWDLDQEIEVDFKDKPIIIGNAVWLMEQKGMWREGQEQAALQPSQGGQQPSQEGEPSQPSQPTQQ